MLRQLLDSLLPLPVPIAPVAPKVPAQLFDGILWATPKRRNTIRRRWELKYGCDNWKFGLKLWKPKRNIITCGECGSFHEINTICRNCFNKNLEATKSTLEKFAKEKGCKPREVWFEPNLVQPKANSVNEVN